ncbi:hypothetical protein [Cryobacterium sp. Y82]|nr:hypothetical protein [Cryobacterium sp. Y82]
MVLASNCAGVLVKGVDGASFARTSHLDQRVAAAWSELRHPL